MKTLPLAKAFMLLEPGPVILVTTADRGKRNVMTISWHMVMDFTPRFALLTGPWSNRPRPEGVALGRPARAGRAHREAPVGGVGDREGPAGATQRTVYFRSSSP
jgi:hypothetical protein